MEIDLLVRLTVDAPNFSQAVEALKPLSRDEAVSQVSIRELPLEALNRLSDFAPLLGIAVEGAKLEYPGKHVQLAVIAADEEGAGHVVARFGADFVQDLKEVTQALTK